jgi:hypothetical protein
LDFQLSALTASALFVRLVTPGGATASRKRLVVLSPSLFVARQTDGENA